MKKILLILVALIGCFICANAQSVVITDVRTFADGNNYRVQVTVNAELPERISATIHFKVCPLNILKQIMNGCEYGSVSFSNPGGQYANDGLRKDGSVSFYCSKDNYDKIQRCGIADFKLEVTRYDK